MEILCICYYFSFGVLLLFLLSWYKRKVTKEKIKAAFFWLLRHFSPLKKKNSLRSNSFFFLTFHPSPSASRQKSEAYIRRNIASLVWVDVFYHLVMSSRRLSGGMISVTSYYGTTHLKQRISERLKSHSSEKKHSTKHPPQTAKRIENTSLESMDENILRTTHLNEQSDVESSVGGPAFSGGAWRIFCSFPWRRKSCLSIASSFSLGKEWKI